MQWLLGLIVSASFLARPMAAQEGCTFTFAVVKSMPDSLTDSSAVYFNGEALTVSLAASPDSLCHVADADGFDSQAALSVPAGEFTALARSVGKKGGNMAFNDVTVIRGKGKPTWTEVDLPVSPESAWVVTGTSKAKAQVRLIAAEPAPPEE
jgi:hypothetical protein